MNDISSRVTPAAMAIDERSHARHFHGAGDLLPLWIAEPYLDLAQEIVAAVTDRAQTGWYGYETRGAEPVDAFWGWMQRRHSWDRADLQISVSPSIGTSIGVLIDHHTNSGDGVILMPPVFTDFKPLIVAAERSVVRSPLLFEERRYRIDVDGLEQLAADPSNRALILCNPHNPVGRVWTAAELGEVAAICARHDVFVIADEIHADLVLAPHRFTPFATVAGRGDVRWAALHGPIKTFGLAGVCDTVLITDDDEVSARFRKTSSQFHLTRNNVFGIAAFTAAYRTDGTWLDRMLDRVAQNLNILEAGLPDPLSLVPPEGTYLAWLDLRGLGLDVPELATWLASSARLALSPGHWFGRQGAGFARMTVAAPQATIEESVVRLRAAVEGRT